MSKNVKPEAVAGKDKVVPNVEATPERGEPGRAVSKHLNDSATDIDCTYHATLLQKEPEKRAGVS